MKALTSTEYTHIIDNVRGKLDKVGFEVHPFKLLSTTQGCVLTLLKTQGHSSKVKDLVGWYNQQVQQPFVLPHHEDTLGILLISTPDMFDQAFRDFICKENCTGVKDPIDECVAFYFKQIIQDYPEYSIDAIHDFELHHSRRPKILVQTVGHVCGAAYYYQRSDVTNDPWPQNQKICGVCIHPKFGGWFALRGVLIFKDVLYSDLVQPSPVDCVPSNQQRIELLEKFNFNWKDWTFRDVISVEKKYSEKQKEYFATRPGERQQIVKLIRESNENMS